MIFLYAILVFFIGFSIALGYLIGSYVGSDREGKLACSVY